MLERRPHPRCAVVRALRAAPPRLKLTNAPPHAPHPSFLVALGVPAFPSPFRWRPNPASRTASCASCRLVRRRRFERGLGITRAEAW